MFSLILGFTVPSYAKSAGKKTKADNRSLLHMMSSLSNNNVGLNVLAKYLKPADYKYLRLKASQSGVRFQERPALVLLKGNKFHLGNPSRVYTFAKQGAEVGFNGKTIKLLKTKSFRENYQFIQSSLSEKKSVSLWSWLVPSAYAETQEETEAYHLTVILSAMEFFTDGGGNIMWDMMLADPQVVASMEALNKKGNLIRDIKCDSIGMIFEFADGTKSFITWAGRDMTMSTRRPSQTERQVEINDKAAVYAGSAQQYYCGHLDERGKQRTIELFNQNLIQPQDFGESYEGSISQ